MSDMSATDIIVQRVGRPYVIEAVRMLEAGEATIVDIDGALQAAGYQMGPLRLLDETGLDVDMAVDRALCEADPETSRFDPPVLQQRLVDEGRLGRAAGRGFYHYDGVPAPDIEVVVTVALPPDAIVERLELAMTNEAYRVVEEGLASPPAVDAAMLAGGYPRGPFELVDGLGLRAVIDRLRATRELTGERSGDQYDVATLLWQMATL